MSKTNERLQDHYLTLAKDTSKIFEMIYIHYRMLTQKITAREVIQQEKNPAIKKYLKEIQTTHIQRAFDETNQTITPEILKDLLLNFDARTVGRNLTVYTTIPSIIDLTKEMINFDEETSYADFGSGIGTSMSEFIYSGVKNVTGFEIFSGADFVARARMELLKEDGYEINDQLHHTDLYEYFIKNPEEKFDFIFSDYPFSMRVQKDSPAARWEGKLFKGINISLSSDWRILALAMNQLTKDGKAIIPVVTGVDFRQIDEEIRQEFISKGYIEKIIQLPTNFHFNTSIPSLLMVLSFGNEAIEFIDASNQYTEKNRQRYFTEEDIKAILADDNPQKKIIENKKVIYYKRLLPSYYGIPAVEDPIKLGEIAEIHRGTSFQKKVIDKIITSEETNNRLIRMRQIQNNQIKQAEYLSELPEKSVLLEDGDILLTRVGSKINIALYQQKDSKITIVDESLLIIRPITEEYGSYYILGYLQSEIGQQRLQANYSGVTVRRISIKDLKKVDIPKLESDKRRNINQNLNKIENEIHSLEQELKNTMKEKEEKLEEWFEYKKK